jgi:hypothetical protein
MRWIAVLASLLIALAPGAALAQAAPPIGYWTTQGDGERLLIEATGSCSFMAVGGVEVAGSCTWNPSSAGGILTLYYSTARGLAPIYWSVIYRNATTITVDGDVFYRRN